jgi:hypothetical protein
VVGRASTWPHHPSRGLDSTGEHVKLQKAGLVGLAAALAAVGIAAPSIAGGNKFDSELSTRECKDMMGATLGTVVLDGPLKLWPPNHKFVAEPVTATDSSGGTESLVITPTVTDAVGGDGGSNHDPDTNAMGEDGTIVGADNGAGGVTAAVELRAERSGKGDGRTYVIAWTAMFDDKTCSSGDEGQTPFVIEVPHDMRGGADWK